MFTIEHQHTLFEKDLTQYTLPKTQYLGSKQKLVDWIYQCSPKNITTFLDIFSGTSSVGYYFKTQSKEIISTDFHIGKALIENKDIILTEEDINLLLHNNKTADNFITQNFTGVFFEKDQAQFLDNFRANIELLDNEYKKSLAFTVINRALTRKVLLGHFAHLKALPYSKDPERVRRNPTIAKTIQQLFLELVTDYNNAIFDNKKQNKVYCEDAITLVNKLTNIDLVYFDPPYCGCHPDYQGFYHFLETYVEYWKDKKLINGTKQYFPKKRSGFVQKSEVVRSFEKIFQNSCHIPYWLISYNSKSYPEKKVMEDLIKRFKQVKVFENEYQNHYGGKGSRKGTREYLFLCYDR